MQECSKGSIGCGWSEIMYLSAVTTVLLTKAEGEERCSYQVKAEKQVVMPYIVHAHCSMSHNVHACSVVL